MYILLKIDLNNYHNCYYQR